MVDLIAQTIQVIKYLNSRCHRTGSLNLRTGLIYYLNDNKYLWAIINVNFNIRYHIPFYNCSFNLTCIYQKNT